VTVENVKNKLGDALGVRMGCLCSYWVSTIKLHTQSYITDSETFIYYTSTTHPVTA